MAITQSLCTSFKVELLQGLHDFTASTGDTFYVALYTSSATLGASTTAYTATGEASGTNYTAGGKAVTGNTTPTSSGTTAYTTPSGSTLTWAASTITARGCMLYNQTTSNRAVCILDFGSDKSSSAGNFTINWPTNDVTNALIRIA